MKDIEFIQKAHHIFDGQNVNKVYICNPPDVLFVEGYFSRDVLIEIAIELIKLEANVRDKLVNELTR